MRVLPRLVAVLLLVAPAARAAEPTTPTPPSTVTEGPTPGALTAVAGGVAMTVIAGAMLIVADGSAAAAGCDGGVCQRRPDTAAGLAVGGAVVGVVGVVTAGAGAVWWAVE